MKTVHELIGLYLEDKRLAWAPTTLKNESCRLYALEETLESSDAAKLWKAIESLAPYSRVTVWTRCADFYEWLLSENYRQGANPYKAFRKKYARQFKNCYTRRPSEITFEEARARISQIPSPAIQKRALEILCAGLRYSESECFSDGFVIGKGNKRRAVYVPEIPGPTYTGSYQTFRRALRKVGLRPHCLRSIFLTEAVNKGANEFQLCELAGWASIATASSYVKANQDATRALVEKIQNGDKPVVTEIQVSDVLQGESKSS